MRIATWNINSVRLRIGLVQRLLAEVQPDVLCLQETKCPDEHYPEAAFIEAGYPHLHYAGIKGYNGVAIVSRRPLGVPQVHARVGREDARHIVAEVEGVELHCLYIPAGGDIPDREQNEKFGHKLDFVDELSGWFSGSAAKRPILACGDFNIAPLEEDVWSHKQLLNVVSHTPVEVEKLTAMQRAGGFTDAIRHFIPPPEKLYSWWSYRARDWAASDRGRRLDHIWVTEPLTPRLKAAQVLRDVRGWERGSDHVPVVLDLN